MDITDFNTWIVIGFSLLIGLTFTLVAWAISQTAAEVPEQNREYHEPPPWGFRIIWWPIHWCAFYIDPILTIKQHEAIQEKLRNAGLDYSMNPAQLLASRFVYGCLASAFGWFIASGFELDVTYPMIIMFMIGMFVPGIWLTDQVKRRRLHTMQTLPFMLDIITLCVESGLNINSAFQQAVDKGPSGPLKDEFARVLRDIRMGKSRADALREMKFRMRSPSISSLTTTLIQAETSGMSLGKVMRAQAEQRRIERFARAEKMAMEAPIKMLFPLLFFIFPIIFFILGFLIYAKYTIDTAA